MAIRRIKNKKECNHSFVTKGSIGFACLECTKCGYWEVL
ncbi:hypothetical protein [Klebsiella phage 31]|uniref:Uncharacterized protein n=1 Tax=Klebsiella phage 31 TaxID=2601667 RepID=A0A5Q2W6C2_9CAUD|nr:hypothetical protein [Klebsiella phage 31]